MDNTTSTPTHDRRQFIAAIEGTQYSRKNNQRVVVTVGRRAQQLQHAFGPVFVACGRVQAVISEVGLHDVLLPVIMHMRKPLVARTVYVCLQLNKPMQDANSQVGVGAFRPPGLTSGVDATEIRFITNASQ